MSSIVDIAELGRRIRHLRIERRMTLKQVEMVCGLSATHLSEIERGRTSPTIGALIRIARALEKEASYFIESEERDEVAHHKRENVSTVSPSPGWSAQLLSAGIPGGGLFPYRVRIEGDEARLAFPAEDLAGDVIYLLQSGRVAAEIGDSEIMLGAGDSLQASLEHAHQIRREGGEPAELLVITTHPIPEFR